jgi:hypothetical protein
MRPLRVLTGLLAGAVLISCGGDGGTGNTDVPTPGNLTVTLGASATAGAGAVLLTVSGGANAIDALAPAGGYTSYPLRLTPGSFRAVLIGPVAGGALATVHVPDTRLASSYTVTIAAVANNTTFAPMLTGGFPVSLVAP